MPPIHVSNVDSVGLAGVSGSHFPPLGVSTPVHGRGDRLRDRGDVSLTQHVVSADIHSVPRSVSSFDSTSLLFPFSDSGFSSFSTSAPVSSFFLLLFLFFCDFCSFVCPSFHCSGFLSSFCCSFYSSSFGSFSSFVIFFPFWSSSWFFPFGFFSSFLLAFFICFVFFPVASPSSSSWFSFPPSSSAVSASSVLPPVSSSSSSPSLNFASYQARVLSLR